VRLVDVGAGQRPGQPVIAHLVAEAGDHGGDLGVVHGRRHRAEAQQEDLHILPGSVEHLHHRLVGQQGAERGEVEARGEGVHDRHLLVARQLHDAELRASRCAPA
jgi:hypothetical protein